jgi:SAM-dependent methyltransferase
LADGLKSMSWREYWNGEHPIYVSERHRMLHFRGVASDLAALVPSPDAVVLDHGCGEALSADRVAAACGRLVLCDSAATVRARLAERFAAEPKIAVVAPEEVAGLADASLDLVVAYSLVQYLTRDELSGLMTLWHAKLKAGGKLVIADVIPPDVGPVTDALQLLSFGFRGGFLVDAFIGLIRTALSDYRTIRSQLGLSMYSVAEMTALLVEAGFADVEPLPNLGHNPHRMTFAGQKAG